MGLKMGILAFRRESKAPLDKVMTNRHPFSFAIRGLLAAALGLSAAACGGATSGQGGQTATGGQTAAGGQGGAGGQTAAATEVSVAGTPGLAGIFDPAPMSDDAGHLWMSHSTVRPSPHSTAGAPLFQVRTRIASSPDKGATWSDIGVDPNAFEDADLQVPNPNGGTLWATWRFEVSRLLHDPFDPDPARRWKLPWHRLLAVAGGAEGAPHFETGWIGLSTAPDPGGPWSPERKLVTGVGYDDAIDAYLGAPEHMLHKEYSGMAELGGCAFFSEPGVLARQEGIYMSLLCARASSHKIVLLRWNHEMTTVEYLGDALVDADAAAFQEDGEVFEGFSASELVETAQAVYLMVTPWVAPPQAYRGCLAFRVADLATATVERKDGAPVLVERVTGVPGSFHGACGWDEAATASGILLSQLGSDPAAPYHMFATHLVLP